MKNWSLARILFWGATVAALVLYVVTVPDGLPWNPSTSLAWAYAAVDAASAALPHPIWGHFIQVLDGRSVVLSILSAAAAAGFVSVLVFRFLGWRLAIAAALAWMFAPWVWNRAVTGERHVCLASVAVFGLWLLVCIVHRVLRRARAARRSSSIVAGGDTIGLSFGHRLAEKMTGWGRKVSWGLLALSGIFVLASLTTHDYYLGEAASAYARGIVEEADGRIIILNGVADEQVMEEVEKKVKDQGQGQERSLSFVSLKDVTDAYRERLTAAVRAEFPDETNLWAAARVGATAFVEVAVRKHPDRFFAMDGRTTTLAGWEKRWEAFKPYLKSSDPFVKTGRRLFGYEGNSVANAMQDEVEKRGGGGEWKNLSWKLYKRIYEEVDPGNLSALVNRREMIRRGYAVSVEESKKVEEALEKFFRNIDNRSHAREIARVSGPIRVDVRQLDELAAEAKRRIAEKVASGEKVELPQEVLTLVEWSQEMLRMMDAGKLYSAAHVARAILSNPAWQGFIPANAVMGSVAAQEGDYVAAEAFFRTATETTNAVPPVVLNDYADVLMKLGRMEEAEKTARRAVKESDETLWVARLTLAQILAAQRKLPEERRRLCVLALQNAPTNRREDIRIKVDKIRREATR